ncbi:hypothetical protein FOXG_16892 [Fusarium oxysporum f. sp. lycopersici 4287]|uniref:ABC transporter domain-containing protein n=2 Tax=Fusarium oxysporum TaxID=5507 RepID=A0A0J9WVJ9_FUSO4|nr:hypothetical protein FOXG_16892 [Fusarium oxysporum f. sp. lycopersici 4287]KNB19662.1 hypothetical protein FOXG_16892 [Fusarium oxysporum f. sp. lycopersici 4287]
MAQAQTQENEQDLGEPQFAYHAVVEPIFIVGVMIASCYFNRLRNFSIIPSSKSADQGLLGQSKPEPWDEEDVHDETERLNLADAASPTETHPPKKRTCCGTVVHTPNSSRYAKYWHSRFIQKFPFLVEMFYWVVNLLFYVGVKSANMTVKTREMEAVKTDAIVAYETVQHNCAVARETARFREHVTVFQRAERLVQWSLNGLNLTQSSIFTLGTALLVSVSAYKISIGEQTVETPGVVEKPDAIQLPSPKGEVSFNDVKFAYHVKKGDPVLDGINFTVAPGTKTAIVGESGSGKSTSLKLLFRFYDVTDGSITIDGHDLRDLKLESLRSNIGVVPQDTVLFNATIMYNLLYARPDATEADVYEACKAANIHERILNFPDGYETKVGERGLKLSGGERQRSVRSKMLSSASPKVAQPSQSHQIIVLHKGKIVERGTHNELLAQGGRYHAMWEKQTTIEKKEKEKKELEGEASETGSQ